MIIDQMIAVTTVHADATYGVQIVDAKGKVFFKNGESKWCLENVLSNQNYFTSPT